MPTAHSSNSLRASVAASRIAALGAGFLDQPDAVVREADLIADVIQGANGVLERDLARA